MNFCMDELLEKCYIYYINKHIWILGKVIIALQFVTFDIYLLSLSYLYF